MTEPFHEQEKSLLEELILLLHEIQKAQIRVVVIGAYAVKTHVTRHRPTQDIDLLAPRDQEDLILNVVKNLGYSVYPSDLMYVARKPLSGGGECRVDIMVGQVVNKHHAISYGGALNEQSIQTRVLLLGGKTLLVVVPSLEDLLLMKLISLRPEDKVDVMSIILEGFHDFDLNAYKNKAIAANIEGHIRAQIRNLALELNEGYLDELWMQYYASRLLTADKEKIKGALKKLEL